MASSIPKRRFYEFGSFRIDSENRLLIHQGEAVMLQPKTFDILLLLVENRSRVLEKDELMRRVWPDTAVEESNLTQNIYILRKIFSADPGGQQYIETIPRRGYRFVARVEEMTEYRIDSSSTVSPALPEHAEGNVLSFPYASEINAEAAYEEPQSREGRAHRQIASLRLIAVITIAAGLAVAAYYFLNEHQPSPKPVRTLAVIPFRSLAANENDESLGLGLSEDLVTRFSSAKRLIVRPSSAVARLVANESDPVAIGRALNVDAVLTGSVQRAEGRVRINAQLIRVEDGEALWAKKFDQSRSDILTMQDHISEQLSEAMTLELSADERRLLTKHYTDNVEAYELYLKAYSYWKKRTQEGMTVAIDYLEQALKKDPHYALAYAGLAGVYSAQSQFGFAPPLEAMPKAEEMANKALEIDPNLVVPHVTLGVIRTFYNWNLSEAEGEFQKAISIDSKFLEAHQYYALCLAAGGRFAESGEQLQIARQIDPDSALLESSTIWVAYLSHNFDEVIARSRKAIAIAPGSHLFHQQLGHAYAAKQMYDPAVAAFEQARLLSGNAAFAASRLGHALAAQGKKKEAQAIVDELHRSGAQPQYLAWAYIGLGNRERVFEWLEKAYQYRSGDLIYLKTDTIYDPLRSDPRFTDLLRRVGLAQ
jgi:DNA-binding winged helix-turn-helix (wHTH) protein/TolB-like protein